MQFWSLIGTDCTGVAYEQAREIQRHLVELRARSEIPDTVLFLEHLPVITQGRGMQGTGLHAPLPQHIPEGIAFSETERGGDLTYHGPGQLVMYPICKLDGQGFGPKQSVIGFLRKLEDLLIAELQARGLPAYACQGATGIWLRGRGENARQKIASIGIAVRKWVTYHGVAINCVNDLKAFYSFSPCGLSPEVMTRLADWVQFESPETDTENETSNWRISLEHSLALRMCRATTRQDSPTVTRGVRVDWLLDRLRGGEALCVSSDHHERLLPLSL